MYYAQVRLGFRVIRKEFTEIEDARRYVKDWCYRYPYSKFTPSIGCDGKLTEYIIPHEVLKPRFLIYCASLS